MIIVTRHRLMSDPCLGALVSRLRYKLNSLPVIGIMMHLEIFATKVNLYILMSLHAMADELVFKSHHLIFIGNERDISISPVGADFPNFQQF